MQKMIGKEQIIRVLLNRDKNQPEELRSIFCKRNWISRIIHSQNFNTDCYGCKFSKVPEFKYH